MHRHAKVTFAMHRADSRQAGISRMTARRALRRAGPVRPAAGRLYAGQPLAGFQRPRARRRMARADPARRQLRGAGARLARAAHAARLPDRLGAGRGRRADPDADPQPAGRPRPAGRERRRGRVHRHAGAGHGRPASPSVLGRAARRAGGLGRRVLAGRGRTRADAGAPDPGRRRPQRRAVRLCAGRRPVAQRHLRRLPFLGRGLAGRPFPGRRRPRRAPMSPPACCWPWRWRGR